MGSVSPRSTSSRFLKKEHLRGALHSGVKPCPGPWYYGYAYWDARQAGVERLHSPRTSYHLHRTVFWMSGQTRCCAIRSRLPSGANRSTYERNVRSVENSIVVLSADSRGYENATFQWLINAESYAGGELTLTIPKKQAPPQIDITCTMSYTRLGSTETMIRHTHPLGQRCDRVHQELRDPGRSPGPSAMRSKGIAMCCRTGDDYVPQGVRQRFVDSHHQPERSPISRGDEQMRQRGAPRWGRIFPSPPPHCTHTIVPCMRSRRISMCCPHRICRSSIPDASARWEKHAIGDGKLGLHHQQRRNQRVRRYGSSATPISRRPASSALMPMCCVPSTRYVPGNLSTARLSSTPYWDMGTVMGDLIALVAANAVVHKGGLVHGHQGGRWHCIHRLRERAACHLFWRARSGPQPCSTSRSPRQMREPLSLSPSLPAYTQSLR